MAVAQAARQFAERLEGKPAPFPVRYLVDAVQPMQEWERALKALALGQAMADDEKIAERFLKASLPDEVKADLDAFLATVDYPLAVRSSSMPAA